MLANLDAFFAMPNASVSPPNGSVRVDILWGPDVLAGAALAVADVLRMVNLLASMRDPRRATPIVWRWWCADGARPPQMLPRGTGFRGVADLLVVPGWHAQSVPHLNQLV